MENEDKTSISETKKQSKITLLRKLVEYKQQGWEVKEPDIILIER